MRATEILTNEHNAIKEMLSIVEEVCKRLGSGINIDANHLDQIVNFIRGFADKCNHAKEENLLFEEMRKSGIPKQGGSIGVMLMEHDYGQEYVKGMAQAIKGYKLNDSDAASEFIKNARGYIEL